MPPELFLLDARLVAQLLLGCAFLHWDERKNTWCGGLITETEAYLNSDTASHSFNGPTKRNQSMFKKGGCLYVYRIYGIHLCTNIVTGEVGEGSAVLLRSLLPLWGLDVMASHRPDGSCIGPARLSKSLGVEISDDSRLLNDTTFALLCLSSEKRALITHYRASRRVGIKKNNTAFWRYFLTEAAYDDALISSLREGLSLRKVRIARR